MQVSQPSAEVEAALKAIEGIENVEAKGSGGYKVGSGLGADHRVEIAATIVEGGWGLLEMRPVGVSLKDNRIEILLAGNRNLQGPSCYVQKKKREDIAPPHAPRPAAQAVQSLALTMLAIGDKP